MKIAIRAKDAPRISLHLPLFFIKSRLVAKMILSNIDDEEISHSVEELHNQIKSAYKMLKKRIKLQGHFNIVEVESADGDRVLIRV